MLQHLKPSELVNIQNSDEDRDLQQLGFVEERFDVVFSILEELLQLTQVETTLRIVLIECLLSSYSCTQRRPQYNPDDPNK